MNGAKRTYYATRTPFYPTKGMIYENEGGGKFKCIKEELTHPTMQNIYTGWTFTACGTGIYRDGKIDWDYSINGHFENPE